MAHHWTARVVLVVGLACPMLSFADRPAETRDQATHVVVGRVEDVYAQEGAAGANRRLVVEIAIEDVERGGGLKAGGTLYASIYRPNPNAPDLKKMTEAEQKRYLLTVDGGHNAPPKPGSRVRVFVIQSGGKYAGVFPDWADVLKEK